jgi:glutathione reductase (NADPH)
MAQYDYDLFTIGAGSGGVRASRVAASFGAKVAVAEEKALGGTCVNVGCIPKKLLVYASHYAEDFRDAAGFGWTVGPRSIDWAKLIANKDTEIHRLNRVYRKLLDDAGVAILEGHAQILDPHTILMDGKRYTAKYILVAVGSWPSIPTFRGSEHVISSNEAFYLPELPEKVIVVGGGYIGVEFAGIFHGLGAQTAQLYRGELFLRGFDIDIRTSLAEEMRKRRIDLRFNSDIAKVEKQGGVLRATLIDGGVIEANQILYATGRVPNTCGLGLENAGVQLRESGAVIVDPYLRSSVENIYAIGDCTDRLMLTPVAIAEGTAVANTLFNDRPIMLDYENVATAIFSTPNCATVGLSEEQARRREFEVDIYISLFRPLRHTMTGSTEKTMMKLVVDHATDRVLGCHMVGPDAGEIIQGLAVALNCGATKTQFDATIGIHPTAAEEFVTMRTKSPPHVE